MSAQHRKTLCFLFLPGLLASYSSTGIAANKSTFETAELRVSIAPRSPRQMAAFYEARGFTRPMLAKIKQYCFMTVYIRNKSSHIIWLDLNNWHFTSNNHPLNRINRNQLLKQWQSMGIPLAHQSTFRWTLLPEQLDFRPNEREGGNIVLPWTSAPINITARFERRHKHTGKAITMRLDNLQCINNPS